MIDYTYSLLKYSTNNVGDEIQSIAAKQFLPKINSFIDRDKLSQYEGPKTKIILNGWFSHKPENWPPSGNIQPLFVALHISSIAYPKFLSKESIEYFKLHQPIGCRDINTVNALKEKGVEAYFSGCLTLTLKKMGLEKTDNIILVDVDKQVANKIRNKLGGNIEELDHFHNKKFNFIKNNFLKDYLYKIDFLKKIGKSKIMGRVVRTITSTSETNIEKFSRAEKLLEKYEKAKLVVTSRIHVALPCLALETPVLFIHENLNDERFRGLIDLFNHYSNSEFLDSNCDFLNKIETNPTLYIKYRNDLIKRCSDFIIN